MTEDDIPVVFGRHAQTLARTQSNRWRHAIPPEDLSQIALMAGVAAFRKYNLSLGVPLHLWIKRKMDGAVIDAFRSHLHLRAGCCSWNTIGRIAPSEWSAVDARLDVRVAMKCLNETERRVITGRYFMDESLAETGVVVGYHFSHVSQIEKAACLKMRTAFAV